MPEPEGVVAERGPPQRRQDKHQGQLEELQGRQVEGQLLEQGKAEELVEVDAVAEGDRLRLEQGCPFPLVQSVQVPVAVQVFMHWAIPFSRIFIEVCGVPEILVKLPVSEACQICVEIENKIEYQEEHREIQRHYWNVPTWEH